MKQIYCHSGGSLFQESEGHFMLLTSALGENSAWSVIEMLLMAKGLIARSLLVCLDHFCNSLHRRAYGESIKSTWLSVYRLSLLFFGSTNQAR